MPTASFDRLKRELPRYQLPTSTASSANCLDANCLLRPPQARTASIPTASIPTASFDRLKRELPRCQLPPSTASRTSCLNAICLNASCLKGELPPRLLQYATVTEDCGFSALNPVCLRKSSAEA